VSVVECEMWKLASNVSAENGIFYHIQSVEGCMNLCLSMSNCVAIDIWSAVVCSVHVKASDLLTNRVTIGVSQLVLDRSCEVSTVSASYLQRVVTTESPTLPATTTTTAVTTDHSTETPGTNSVIEGTFTKRFLDIYTRLQVTSPKDHWSDIYVECNDQVNIIT